MTDFRIENKDNINFLITTEGRVFIPSNKINIFPCSRRGRYGTDSFVQYYDPEARLNTERTNRIGTAINGFTDSFIVNTWEPTENSFVAGDTLVFALAGYRIEIKNFNPATIAEALELVENDIIYAHLSLHTNISLEVADYRTEILYRQSSEPIKKQYLDVFYSDTDSKNQDTFFVGISFTKDAEVVDMLTDATLVSHNLALFKKSNESYPLVQTSLLPKIKHDETEDSIKIFGDFTIEHTKEDGTKQVSFKVVEDKTTLGPTEISELTVTEKTTLNGPFNVKLDDDTAFEISADGVTTINTQVHITKATTVDGVTNLASTVIDNLTVGDMAGGEAFPQKGVIVAETAVKTPALNVNTITSDSTDGLKINPAVTLASTLSVTDKVTANNGLEVSNSDVKVTKGNLTVNKNITVDAGNITVTAGGINAANGTVIAKEISAENITQNGNAIPAIDLVSKGTAYQLQITLDASKKEET
jgi:hypothetical protein